MKYLPWYYEKSTGFIIPMRNWNKQKLSFKNKGIEIYNTYEELKLAEIKLSASKIYEDL